MKLGNFRINRELLPLKVHYFLFQGGLAPVVPFIPVTAKRLGFSAVSVGWMFTVTPIVLTFVKPLVGSVADRFKIEKATFLFVLAMTAASLFSVQWVPPLQRSTSARVHCKRPLVEICSEDTDFREKLLSNSLLCKAASDEDLRFSVARNHQGTGDIDNNTELGRDGNQFTGATLQSQDICYNVELLPSSHLSTLCGEGAGNLTQPVNFDCSEKSLPDSEILYKYQFWVLISLVVTSRVFAAVCNTLADSICLNLLEGRAEDYGAQRMWGSLSWGVVGLLSKLLADLTGRPEQLAFYVSLAFFSLDLLVVATLKVNRTPKSKNIFSDVTTVLKNTKIILFLVWCFFLGFFFSSIGTFIFWFVEALDLEQGGTRSQWINTLEGLVQFMQTVLSEVPVLFFSGWIIKTIGYGSAMAITLLVFAVRFFLYSILVDPWLTLPIELLHGISYGIGYAVLTTHAKMIARPGTECTVQSLVSVTYEGGGVSAGSFVTGYFIEALGYSKTFSLTAISAFALAVAQLCLSNVSLIYNFAHRFTWRKGELKVTMT